MCPVITNINSDLGHLRQWENSERKENVNGKVSLTLSLFMFTTLHSHHVEVIHQFLNTLTVEFINEYVSIFFLETLIECRSAWQLYLQATVRAVVA